MANPKPKAGPGRPPGARNKITMEIKEIARQHGPDALQTLVKLMKDKQISPPARVAAAKEIMDRAYGKSIQSVTVDPESAALVIEIRRYAGE